MNKVRAFQCEHCRRKVMMNKAHLAAHEKKCFYNPQRKACQTCGNRTEEWETVYNRHHGGNPGSTDYETKTVYCEVKEKEIYKLPAWERNNCKSWKEVLK